ncbi:MAG: hypothetical protein BAJATHORv1_30082 [Candidatus Thorarchaeota archaeon]|nr:MAG: hypothetical protein BAJATHORv1_30082 [Candidatus Thorarchaeota archaeon]
MLMAEDYPKLENFNQVVAWVVGSLIFLALLMLHREISYWTLFYSFYIFLVIVLLLIGKKKFDI